VPLAGAGVLGFKCFLSPSGVDEFVHLGEADLEIALAAIAPTGLPLLAHAEWPALLRDAPAGADPCHHSSWLATRPPESECAAIDVLIRCARSTGGRVHVVHLAAPEALPAIAAARAGGVRITVETCPHYLTFAADEIPDRATAFKCAPPIRDTARREALWGGLRDGAIDSVATDHSPAPPALKGLDHGDFFLAWGGIASLQLLLPAVWTGAAERGVPASLLTSWLCAAPAALAGLTQKGRIAAGCDADFVIWDPDASIVVEPEALEHRHPLTPYAGRQLRGLVSRTILRGEVIAEHGARPPAARGRLLSR
jgi:allantoinase